MIARARARACVVVVVVVVVVEACAWVGGSRGGAQRSSAAQLKRLCVPKMRAHQNTSSTHDARMPSSTFKPGVLIRTKSAAAVHVDRTTKHVCCAWGGESLVGKTGRIRRARDEKRTNNDKTRIQYPERRTRLPPPPPPPKKTQKPKNIAAVVVVVVVIGKKEKKL